MLNKEDALRCELTKEGNRNRYNWIFKCKNCDYEIKSRIDHLKKHSGNCYRCSKRLRPFEHSYSNLKKAAREKKLLVTLTYEEFFEFTSIKNCHYCHKIIERVVYTRTVKPTHAYYLDRTNNNLGYIKDNLVVCCSKCNKTKGSWYTYEEWYGMTEYFRNKKKVIAKEIK